MCAKLITVLIMAACMIVQAKTAAVKQHESNMAAIFVEDLPTGQLRFLGNRFGSSQINQLITNKKDFLEQLRPGGINSDNGIAIITPALVGDTETNLPTTTNLDTTINTVTGTDGTAAGADLTGTGVNGASNTRIRPVVINPNRRRKFNRRRGNKRPRGNRRPQIFIIRPRS